MRKPTTATPPMTPAATPMLMPVVNPLDEGVFLALDVGSVV